MNLPYRLIAKCYVFVVVINESSFTRAAERLGLGKAVVSRHISELENTLGVKLLNRNNRRLSMTEAGSNLYEDISSLPDIMTQAIRQLDHEKSEVGGTLRISAPGDFGAQYVVPQISRFLQQYPQITIDLHCDDNLIDLNRQDIDVTFQVGGALREDRVAHKLMDTPHRVYMSPAMAAKYSNIRHPSALSPLPAVTLSILENSRQWLFTHPEQNKFSLTLNQQATVNSVTAMRTFITHHPLIGIMPEATVSEAVKRGEIISVLDDWRLPSVPVYLSYKAGELMPLRVRRFVDFIQPSKI